MSDTKKVRVTPRGGFLWCHVRRPDKKYKKYSISLKLPKDDGGPNDQWRDEYLEAHKAANGTVKKAAFKDGDKATDKDDNPIESLHGFWIVKFTTNYEPKVVDAKKNIVPKQVNVWGGDEGKIAFVEFQHDEGISLKVQAIMLLKKNSSDGGAAIEAFEEEEGDEVYVYEGDGSEFSNDTDDTNGHEDKQDNADF